jgi:(4S)-4-hydroxy-5-phosphonooxypentane-2,3-dione isomerase
MARICIIVDFRIKPGHYNAFNAHIRAHAAATLAEEPGCLSFDVTQPLAEDGTPDESRIMLVEIYKDQAAFDIHRNGPRMPSVAAGSKPLLDGRVLTVCQMD